jgi:hypothetical protein
LALVALLGLVATPHARAADGENIWQTAPYTLGQGLYFPQLGLRIGGYADLHFYDVKDQPATYSFRDISLFVTKDFGTRWQAFVELDVGDAFNVSGRHTNARDSELDVERAYMDYHANQAINFRFGKFLTPVGEWNLVHADPLTWTVSRPLTTSAAFARHATGAMMYGTESVHGNDLDYWLYADDSANLHIGQDQDHAYSSFGANSSLHNNFRQAIGGRLLYHLLDDRLGIGLSWLDYELQQPRQQYRLAGVDFSWTGRYLEMTGEAIRRNGGSPGQPDEQGGFLEIELPLRQRLYAVGRFERYRSSALVHTVTMRTVGLNYRPIPGIVLKLERRDGNQSPQLAPAGWLASVAVLF